MKFRTEYTAERASFTLSPDSPVVLLGSCFADNIRRRMRESLWDADNPLGTLYNPFSIERSLRMCLDPQTGGEGFGATLFESGGIWHSWMFDSSLSSSFPQQCADDFARISEDMCNRLDEAEALIVTFGTSWCWHLAAAPETVVANCHKQPASMFVRRRLTVCEIVERWENLAIWLRGRYPRLRIIFTVSPVRHMKEGFAGNSRSKAVLQLAVEELCTRLPFCHYFPAYEIVNDDLRDYRFYASDLAHPSEEAVDYIWEIFKATYLDAEGVAALKEGEGLSRRLAHRALVSQERKSEALICSDSRQRAVLLDRCREFHAIHPRMLDPVLVSPC